MSKKLITACMALFALAAFALPAAASASPELTHPTGTTLAVGSKITGTSIGHVTLWNTGHTTRLVTCTTGSLTGTLTKNNGTTIEGNIESSSFTGNVGTGNECEATFGTTSVDTNIGNGVPWCVKASGTEDKFTVRGNSCANEARSITFVLTTSIGTCKYNRTAAVGGTLTTDIGGQDAVLHVVPTAESTFVKEEGSVLCPASGELEMSITLETDTSPASPMYIS